MCEGVRRLCDCVRGVAAGGCCSGAAVENLLPEQQDLADDYKNYLKKWEKLDISTLPI